LHVALLELLRNASQHAGLRRTFCFAQLDRVIADLLAAAAAAGT
jgi:hypothetical protein